ncbi:AlpA family phage regulatory protein [Paraburkholderia sp. BR14263]|uniref:AlpA family phage regulatory protein n=1 Tax=unclassified Paraburkholderia TaxID=2615204 RepID=UPI0034CFB4A9
MKAIRIREVAAKVGLGQPTLYRTMADGRFPKSFELVPGRTAWIESDIDDWLAGKVDGGIPAADTTHAAKTPPAAAQLRNLIERHDIEAPARRIAARLRARDHKWFPLPL